MEAICSSGLSVEFAGLPQHFAQQNRTLHSQRRENLKSNFNYKFVKAFLLEKTFELKKGKNMSGQFKATLLLA
jgi:hypothetical protein